MDANLTTPPPKFRGLGKCLSLEKTPPQSLQTEGKPQSSIEDGRDSSAPDPSKVPKAFAFTERYMSPTDRIISPVSKGLLARNRKLSVLLPPTKTPSKAMDICF
ncbi:hypothetical protein MRB53_005564 [Persea americana]|uniref:Uncharacterized protein n=1 Tax=Persea americana TaxID=3435 RepID=A0ACC2MDV0_PERAE|nr:hypothetical protein MRB53_005564 [Persea americana]|eukprot:TRINITY_DN30249_c0_g1_i1.p1 TRINITY_DN30249_c0_g1~~TRINITY_DN30249_c0_g1_i1.p1  ORF type:complete len:104 (+),score=14.95 TRINITY_DN30249_c0_g1_i1:136-447(+)